MKESQRVVWGVAYTVLTCAALIMLLAMFAKQFGG
jgi:hypothetical protein